MFENSSLCLFYILLKCNITQDWVVYKKRTQVYLLGTLNAYLATHANTKL